MKIALFLYFGLSAPTRIGEYTNMNACQWAVEHAIVRETEPASMLLPKNTSWRQSEGNFLCIPVGAQ